MVPIGELRLLPATIFAQRTPSRAATVSVAMSRPNLLVPAACFLLLAAFACIDRTVTSVTPVPSKEEQTVFPVVKNENLDILFVIDNSRSMLAEQDSLAVNFVRIAETLENIEGGPPNVHIGVVSTDLGAGGHVCGAGDDGRLQSTPRVPGCDAPTDRYISNIGGVTNYAGSLSDAFSCIARLGRDGCGFEQPLEAMRRALDGSNPENAGFLRDGAILAVIFITDEDDCSVFDPGMFARVGEPGQDLGAQKSFRCFENGVMCDGDVDPRQLGVRSECQPRNDSDFMPEVAEYVTFLKGLKEFETDIFVAGIVGASSPIEVTTDEQGDLCLQYSCGDVTVCAGAEEETAAVPPVRLKAFLDAFQNTRTTSICSEDLSGAVQQVADAIEGLFNDCLKNPIRDMDENAPGLQPECSVVEVRRPTTPQQVERVLEACDDGATRRPCYRLVEDRDQCPAPQHLLVDIVYDDSDTVPPDTLIRANCVGE